jgi:hypothetical protein
MSLTHEQIEGIKQFEKDRAEIINRVMAKYKVVNGKWVKIEIDKKKK